jgi:hypothetical protein
MVKTDMLAFRVEADVKAALERAAAADDRSVSSLVERVLRAWLTKYGHMQVPPAPNAAARKKVGSAKP